MTKYKILQWMVDTTDFIVNISEDGRVKKNLINNNKLTNFRPEHLISLDTLDISFLDLFIC